MPLVNQTGSPASDYLSDGITESLIGRLSQIPNLSVMARSSVFRFKGKDIAPKDIGKDLNVPAILTGRVSRSGDAYSLYIELVDAATEKVLWSAEYNRPESNLTTIPGEVARDVAENLKKKLSGIDEQRLTRNYTNNSAAYELYLKGRYYWDKRNEEAYKVAEDAYKQAIALDPNYALAYAGLADCYLFREIGLGRDVAMPLAKQYALKALELDESLAEAHTTLAFVNSNYDLDFASGEKEFKRAIELKPNYAVAHQFYGALLVATNRMDQGLAEMRRAVDLEPYTITINWSLGMGLGFAHRYDESIAQLQKTLQLQPEHALSEGSLTGMLIQTGKYDEAMTLIQKHLAVPERRDGALSSLAVIYAKTGRISEAQKILAQLLANDTKSQNNPYSVARVYAALGEKDKAIDWLSRAVDRRSFSVWFMRVDPSLDSLHGDPRFENLMRRIGLNS
jgi:TolB-like protein/Tfp pilus assembly protein PilF